MLRRYTWEKVREECQHYRRRRPETSTLYQVVYHTRHSLEYSWTERFQPDYGSLRAEVLQVYDEYLNCGLLSNGVARVYCDSCKHSLLVAFSCKKRGVCPSCSVKRAVKFAEHIYAEVLEREPHRHIVFSIPKRLRVYFRYDRKLCSILFRAAWWSIASQVNTEQASPGLILTLQTAGESLNFNPHLHGLISDGVFAADGTPSPLPALDLEVVTRVFAEGVLAEFAKRELITDEVMRQILSQEHSGFSVWLGEPFQDEQSDKFVARYVERGPLSLEKLAVTGAGVSYTTKDGATHEFDPLEFLARLSAHIPNSYESITRYYGYYSCRARGERKKREAQSQVSKIEPLPESSRKPSSSWAACIKQIYEIDPLECPKCRSQMRIVAFVQDPQEIKKIMQSLGLPDSTAPPPLPKGSTAEFEQYCLDEIPDYDTF